MLSKRTLFALGFVLVLALAVTGCAAPVAAPTGGEAAAPAGGEAATPAAGGKLEVFSWWTSGGEAAALQALFDAYNAQYPDVEIVNATVAGGGGSQRAASCRTRLRRPAATCRTPGRYIPASSCSALCQPGYVAPVTDLYEAEGWNDVMPEALRTLMTKRWARSPGHRRRPSRQRLLVQQATVGRQQASRLATR